MLHYWRDRLVASDPAREAWRTGLRALATAAATSAVLLLLGHVLHVPSNVSLLGVIVPLMSTVAVRDPSPAGQKKTLALFPVVAVAVAVLGSLLGDHPWLSVACFVAIVFAAFALRSRGPRAAGLGNMAYQGFFYALLLQPQAADAGWIALFVVLGTAIGYVVRFHLLPERPQEILAHQVQAWRACLAALLRDLAEVTQGSDRAKRRVDAGLTRLQDIGLGIEGRLAQFAPPPDEAAAAPRHALRDRLLAGELAAGTLAALVQPDGPATVDAPQRLHDTLLAVRHAIRTGQVGERASDGALAAVPADLRERLDEALADLRALAAPQDPLPPLQQEHAAGSAPAAHSASPRSESHHIQLDESTRAAVQASVAALGASIVGRLISADHWYWAVFAAFILFTRSSSVGQTLSTAWQGVVANVIGVALGLGLAEITQGSRNTQLVLLFASIGPAFYAFRAWQPLYTMMITAILAMLYGVLGEQVPRLLEIRLADTLAGALIAVACARLVLPARTSEHGDQQSAAVLRDAAALLRDALQPPPRKPPRDAVRNLDRQLQALRQALAPVSATSYPARKEPHRRRLQQLTLLAGCVRHFFDESARHPESLADSAGLNQAAQRLGANMEALADALEDKPPAGRQPVPSLDPTDDAAGSGRARRTLQQADEVLRALAAEADTREGDEGRLHASERVTSH